MGHLVIVTINLTAVMCDSAITMPPLGAEVMVPNDGHKGKLSEHFYQKVGMSGHNVLGIYDK